MARINHAFISNALRELGPIDFKQVATAQQQVVLGRIIDRFLASPDVRWWWEGLKVTHRLLEGASLNDVPAVCPDPGAPVFLVPCDTRPLLVYETDPSTATLVLNECPFMEYAIVAQDFSWMIIENHHRAFIVAGDIEFLNVSERRAPEGPSAR